MAQEQAGVGFYYPVDVGAVLQPWREKLGADAFDPVVAKLSDQFRALEDYTLQCVASIDQIVADEGTTSLTPVDLATVGPTCVVKLPRGRCIVTVTAYTWSSVTNQSAIVDLFIDGAFAQTMLVMGNNTGGSIGATLSGTFLFTDLDPGTHTFQLKYWSSNGAEVRFDARTLLVDPVA